MAKSHEEWLKQANYDLDTADYMFKGGRYMYTVFMCHLSIEKALKGLYTEKLRKEPPKTHNLLYLNELPRSKLTGYQNSAMRFVLKASPPNVFIGGPVPNQPGFPLKACGNDGLRIGNLLNAASCGESTHRG